MPPADFIRMQFFAEKNWKSKMHMRNYIINNNTFMI